MIRHSLSSNRLLTSLQIRLLSRVTISLCLLINSLNVVAADRSNFEPPLTEHKQPDLQGTWFFGSTTPFTRDTDLGDRGSYTEIEIQAIEEEAYKSNLEQDAPLDPDRPSPEAGAYVGFEADFNFATKRHLRNKVMGEYRTSLVIEPADGQLPRREGFKDYNAKRLTMGIETYSSAQASDPGERCLAGGLAIPSIYPMPWNANLQIVQNEHYVMIMTEMIHDARIIKLSGSHLGDHMAYWFGDSIGYWESNTLNIHTKNFRAENSSFLMPTSEELEVLEQLTLIGENEILYRVEVSDPLAYTEKFVVERTISRRPDNESIYEFACHEGNYSLKWMLTGARRAELDAKLAETE